MLKALHRYRHTYITHSIAAVMPSRIFKCKITFKKSIELNINIKYQQHNTTQDRPTNNFISTLFFQQLGLLFLDVEKEIESMQDLLKGFLYLLYNNVIFVHCTQHVFQIFLSENHENNIISNHLREFLFKKWQKKMTQRVTIQVCTEI